LLLVYSDRNPAYKIAWIIPILIVPIFGGLIYLSFGGHQLTKKELKKMKQVEKISKESLDKNCELLSLIAKSDKDAAIQAKYIQDNAPFPIYDKTSSHYYPIGEKMFEDMLIELNKAKKFIFMEYFIVEEGKMWNSLLEVLQRKVKEGVEVRFMYDGFGSLLTLPGKYNKQLKEKGIKCVIYNPLYPILTVKYNTRDHRKIMVIDGDVAFTGGINLADEYINEIERFGHWKDTGIKIKGEAVWNFTVMFLSLWDAVTMEETNYLDYKSTTSFSDDISDGYLIPFSDTPLDEEPVGQNVYINMISRANDYVYITTPYLIIDSEMINSLSKAAKSGVDVKIITPHIADKILVHETTRTYYKKLIDSGVKIYEYEPGFMHGKVILADDKYAIVGTINMDFRSLFLHFECGVWMYNTSTLKEIKHDFLETEKISLRIDDQFEKNISFSRRVLRLILRMFAPLL